MNNNVSLLIIGYDPYKDVWDHYFELLEKYWQDRPLTYLASNELNPQYSRVQVIPAGIDAEWSMKVITSLPHIKTEYVILLLEDFFTTSHVDNEQIDELISYMDTYKLNYCKLLNQSKIRGKKFIKKNYLRVIDSNDEYGISLQPAIWRKSFLSEVVGRENYNAWIFEFSQVRDRRQNRNGIDCIGDRRNVLKITHAVVQSKYLRKAVRVFKRQKYKINLEKRPMFSITENFKYRAKCFFSEHSPKILKPFLKKIGKKIGVDFVSDRQLKEKDK